MTEGIKRFHFDEPMEARSVATIPEGSQWQYEPKWDGFRCLLGRSGEEITMRSKAGRDLARYFPEIVAASKTLPERHFIMDGEIVILLEGGFSFEALLQRIHPAATRIRRLSGETPATFLAFDLLKWGRRNIAVLPLQDRRKQLENFADRSFGGDPRLRLSPASKEIEEARRWLAASGQGSDGIIAKRVDLPYQGGTRDGMQKIKRARTADCVVGGFRYGERRQSGRKVIGSLLLGLYDDRGDLNHVGFTSAIKVAEKSKLTPMLEAIATDQSFTGSAPGGPSRWATLRSSQWQPVKPKFVVEVSYDHFTGGRFRHGTTIVRWRPDKKPTQCKMDQID
jgi:ATP-dependent DNA ligase